MTRVDTLDITDTTAARARLNYVPGEILHRAHTASDALSRPKPRTVRIALAGCGVVGGALVRLLYESSHEIAARHGIRFEITSVLVRDLNRDRGLPIPTHLYTNDLDTLLDAEADVVVEAIGGTDVAGEIARRALGGVRRFITANKELISQQASDLASLARQSAGSFDFGAAVGGSAPVISLLRDLLGVSVPRSVRGILNGTSNFILSQLDRGESFESARDAAQAKGLAEADISRDLDGRDPAAKLAIIAWISYGIDPRFLIVRRIGLDPDPSPLAFHANAHGGRLRFVADCTVLDGNKVCASVEPVLVNYDSALARTDLEDNRVEVDLGWASPLTVSGPGAGGTPTATALLGDLVNGGGPANERGAARTEFASVEDPRCHDWLLVGSLRLSQFQEGIRRSALALKVVCDNGFDSSLIVSGEWPDVERAVASVRQLGATVLIARVEEGFRRESVR